MLNALRRFRVEPTTRLLKHTKMKKEPVFISVEYTAFGSLVLSTVYKSQRISQTYYGYGEKEARKQFKKYLKTLK